MDSFQAMSPGKSKSSLAVISIALAVLPSLAVVQVIREMRSDIYMARFLWSSAWQFLNDYWPLSMLLAVAMAIAAYAKHRNPTNQFVLIVAILCLMATIFVPPFFAPRIR